MVGPFPYLPWQNGPAAPACQATISWNGKTESIPAVIDSGASHTTIPAHIAKKMRLAIRDKQDVTGATGQSVEAYEHLVNLSFLGLKFPNHVVWGIPRPYILIGRDILNRYKTILDGPIAHYSLE